MSIVCVIFQPSLHVCVCLRGEVCVCVIFFQPSLHVCVWEVRSTEGVTQPPFRKLSNMVVHWFRHPAGGQVGKQHGWTTKYTWTCFFSWHKTTWSYPTNTHMTKKYDIYWLYISKTDIAIYVIYKARFMLANVKTSKADWFLLSMVCCISTDLHVINVWRCRAQESRGTCPKQHTSCALVALWVHNGSCMCLSGKSTRLQCVPFSILAFRRSRVSSMHTELKADSQSSITSWKCGLEGLGRYLGQGLRTIIT